MLQERPLWGVTVELVQAWTIALLVALLAVAVLSGAVLGFAWARAKLAVEKLRAWYADIATRRVLNDAKRSQRLGLAPTTLRGPPPPEPMKRTPQPPPLPTIPVVTVTRPKRRPPPLPRELAQTSPDWSDNDRKTVRFPVPPAAGDAVTDDQLDFDDATDPDEPPPRR